jgi:hypothetical protein
LGRRRWLKRGHSEQDIWSLFGSQQQDPHFTYGRCLKRGQELQQPHLVAFSRLSLARFCLRHGTPAEGGDASGKQATEEAGAASPSAALEVCLSVGCPRPHKPTA